MPLSKSFQPDTIGCMKYDKINFTDKIIEGKDVSLEDLSEIYCIASRLEKICEEKKISGVSATQCEIPLNFFVLEGTPLNPSVYLNCRYEPLDEGLILSIERCPSLINSDGDQRIFEVFRFKKIKLTGKKLRTSEKHEQDSFKLEDIDLVLDGSNSSVFQRMIDYSFGDKKTIDKIGKEIFLL